MVQVFLGLGANIGDPAATISAVLKILKDNHRLYDFRSSRLYRTSPVGGVAQPDFINAACSFETDIPLFDLLKWTQEIEGHFGKCVITKNGPRTIDIDILAYGEVCVCLPALEIPHPRMLDRLFVLVPLSDITDSIPCNGKIFVGERIRKVRESTNDSVKPIERKIEWIKKEDALLVPSL